MPELIQIGMMVAIIILAAGASKAIFGDGNSPGRRRHARRMANLSRAERDKALEIYRDLAREKMDVMKTAVTMGYSENELDKLDRRLQEIGELMDARAQQIAAVAEESTA